MGSPHSPRSRGLVFLVLLVALSAIVLSVASAHSAPPTVPTSPPPGAAVAPMKALCRLPSGVAPAANATLADVQALCAQYGTPVP